MSRGVVYTAVNDLWVQECIASIKTVRYYRDIAITVFTPDAKSFSELDVDIKPMPITNHARQCHACANTPYKHTLFLDTDTILLSEEALLPFRTLGHFDLAAAHAPVRGFHRVKAPNCYPQFNVGVLFYTSALIPMMKRWEVIQKRNGGLNQPSFTSLAYKSQHRIATLTPEWNYRSVQWNSHVANLDHVHIGHHHGLSDFVQEDGRVDKEAVVEMWKDKIKRKKQ